MRFKTRLKIAKELEAIDQEANRAANDSRYTVEAIEKIIGHEGRIRELLAAEQQRQIRHA